MSDDTSPSNGHEELWPSTGVGSTPVAVESKEAAPKRVLATIGFMLDATRRRRSGRMILWFLVVALALGGTAMLMYPFATDLWAKRIQSDLAKDFGEQGKTPTSQDLAAFKARQVKTGDALTRLHIPKLGVSVIVVEGITGNALRAGAGHYPTSALPCQLGNVAIAGHRTGFGEPFRHLERLKEGYKITLTTPIGKCTYEVIAPFDGHANPWITGPKDWSVVGPTPQASLTLTTCDPPGTSKNRLIVRARLVSQV